MKHRVSVAAAGVVGILAGLIGAHALSANPLQMPVRRTPLIQTPLVDGNGREAHMYITEIDPGVDAGRHYHHAHTFVYVLDGAITIQEDGKSPETFRAGQAFTEPPNVIHDARNASGCAPVKLLVFQAPEAGRPVAVPVK